MNAVFDLVFLLLSWLSSITGLSYKAINIIAYYIVIPLIYLHLIDRLNGKHYFKIAFSIFIIISLLIIKDFEVFSQHLFDLSVKFLNWFNIIGWNYVEASVIICVLIPLILFIVLFYYAYKVRIKSFINYLLD